MGFTLGFRLFLLQSNIFSVKSVNTIDHCLNQLNFRVSQTMLIGNVVGTASLTTRFTTGTTGLYIQFLASGLQFVNTFLGPSGQVDVDGSSHTSTQVGGAGVQVSQSFIEHEFPARFSHDRVPNSLDTSSQLRENTLDIAALIHGNNSKLIFLVDPDQERFISVMENTATFRPVSLHTSSNQVFVTRNEKEMVIDQLLSVGFEHTHKWIKFSGQITLEFGEGAAHQFFNTQSLIASNSGGKSETFNASAHTNSGTVNWCGCVDVSDNFGVIHVGCMFETLGKSMVFHDEGVKDISKDLVGVLITSIDTTAWY